MLEDFTQDKKIDPEQLDLEAAEQAEKFFKYAEASAKARGDMDQAKLAMDVLEAELVLDCRQAPEKYGLTKTTEGAIQAAVKCNVKMVKATKDFLDKKQASHLLEIAVQAMDQRKRMIEVLITLHGQKYFAGPSVPRDLVSAWKERQEDVSVEVNEKMKKRRRRRKNEEVEEDD